MSSEDLVVTLVVRSLSEDTLRGVEARCRRRAVAGVAQRSVRAAAAPRARQRRMGRSGGVAESGPPQRHGRSNGSCG